MSTISLVTGANRGIGREVCRQLAELGHTVILTARDSSAAAEAAQAIRAEPLQLDVTDPASVTRAARWAQDRHGKLDVLVNNAAITYDTWQRAVSSDLAVVRETYTASKAALNALTRMLADELRRDRILVNAVCPGWVATDMGGPGGRPLAAGAASVVWAAALPDSGPTGGFFRDGRPLPW
jgi:NAD(P)-dependent dehydrogenase (short-subunit alcohol dehydrogenase family)